LRLCTGWRSGSYLGGANGLVFCSGQCEFNWIAIRSDQISRSCRSGYTKVVNLTEYDLRDDVVNNSDRHQKVSMV
jgi:hypothetical protein